ncbi:hypothetical protein BJ742DRAFT_679041 [Cladochytrium replicatum]|nr:hypothetical protein BJ742DRAFT_679041 [Cladochytrium replicatum]
MYLLRDHFTVRAQLPPSPPDRYVRKSGNGLWGWFRTFPSVAPRQSNSTEKNEVVDGSNLFDRTVRQIEKVTLSSSPDVVFPPPYLLLRLRDEEKFINERAQMRQTAKDVVNHLALGVSVKTPAALEKDQFRTQPIEASYSSNAPVRRLLRSSHSQNRISVDSKAGLRQLTTNNNSIAGVIRHQSMTFSYSYFRSAKSGIPCQPPKILTVDYYMKRGSNQDRTLGQYLELLCTKAKGSCADPSCGHPMDNHIITYTHGTGRISVFVEDTHPNLAQPPDFSQIYAWTQCKICQRSTEVVPMSDGTWHASFGKYLEILLYNPAFLPARLCTHVSPPTAGDQGTSENRQNARRYYRFKNRIIIFEYEPISLFEMRVPRLQVGPDHGLQERVARLAVEAQEWMQNRKSRTSGRTTPDSTKSSIGSTVRSSQTPKTIATPTEVSIEPLDFDEIMELLTDATMAIRDEERELRNEAGQTIPWCMNNVRNEFQQKFKGAMNRVAAWAKENSKKTSLPFRELPDWCTNPRSHIFPNSFVLVRENEPTSIIAYALSPQTLQISDRPGGKKEGSLWPPMNGQNGNGGNHGNNSSLQFLGTTFRSKVRVFSHEPGVAPCHIKYRFIEDKTSFSCTMYYAEQFDSLRRRCGLNDTFIRSLSRCVSWQASGGKSKATFFRTSDDTLIIKQLAQTFTVVEKNTLLKFAPSYFEYIGGSDKNPSILAKIFGFYTIKRKNLVTKEVMKLDVLVMENVFSNMKISRKFDLKGVPDRHIAEKTPNSAKNQDAPLPEVMWDGDWVDGRYKSVQMLHSHSKNTILESVKNDTAFLAASNVMDYSLVVGVNDDKKELVVGIVDFIGTYTWYKRLETQGKMAVNTTLRGGKLCTVLPPAEYAERFRAAMDQYFEMVSVVGNWISCNSETRNVVGPRQVDQDAWFRIK